MIGDGYCNDEYNTAKENYDGGDCCLPNINTEHCTECVCHLKKTCKTGNHPLVGDGYCNDETNNADCNYDGGDCCGSCVNTDYCTDCICIDDTIGTGFQNALLACKTSKFLKFWQIAP